MDEKFLKLVKGYKEFREKYASGESSKMDELAKYGQKPPVMVVSCCDSRVDPSIIFQCDPGDLFVVRNVANIVPAFHEGKNGDAVNSALEFGIRFLKVKHLVLLGHSQCGGIRTLLLGNPSKEENDFITGWVSTVKEAKLDSKDVDNCAQRALHESYKNCFTFPWIEEKVASGELSLHRWFFDIEKGQILSYRQSEGKYQPLSLD